MTTISSINIQKDEILTSAHLTSIERFKEGFFVISGCDVHESSPNAMSITIGSGLVQFGWGTTPVVVAGGVVSLTASDPTYPKIIISYIDINGVGQKYEGVASAISPADKTAYPKQWAEPYPGASIPTGVILSRIVVGAGVTTIVNANIDDIACKGTSFAEAPLTATTAGKIPKWSSTPKTLDDGVDAPTGTLVGTTDAQNLSGKTFTDAPILDLGGKYKQIVSPSAPATGYTHVYAKVDGKIYCIPAGGAEAQLGLGDVIGPASNTDLYVPQWNGANNKTLKNGLAVGSTANCLLQLNSSAQIPAVSGILITGIVKSPATNTNNYVPQWDGLNSRLLKDGLAVGVAAYNLLQLNSSAQIPAVNGILLTNVATLNVLTTPGDTLTNSGGALARIPKGATGQSYVQGVAIPEWKTCIYDVAFPFGDGISIMLAGSCAFRIPDASKIISARIRSFDSNCHLVSGSVTCNLYSHAIDANEGTIVDTFTLTSDTDMTETGLSIIIPANTWISVKTSNITSCKQIVLTFEMELT